MLFVKHFHIKCSFYSIYSITKGNGGGFFASAVLFRREIISLTAALFHPRKTADKTVLFYTTPCAIIASATFSKPAMFAPTT